MNRCKTCKHWTCKTIFEWMDVGECNRLMWSDKIGWWLNYDRGEDTIVGEIVTYADFGCVLWEESDGTGDVKAEVE